MKSTDLKVNLTEKEREEILLSIANKLNIAPDEVYSDETMTTLEIPCDGSLEGVSLAIGNNKLFRNYYSRKDAVELGILKDGWHFYINPWVYTDSMTQSQLDNMLMITKKLLVELPDAVLYFQDDPWDFNPNSSIPEHRDIDHCKSETLNIDEHFEIEEE